MIRFVLSVAALVIASAMPANAGPVFVAVLAAGGTFGAAFGATAFGSFLTTTMLGRLLTSVALGALRQALAPKAKSGQNSGIQTNITQTGADKSVSWVMGKYATAGVMACPPMTHGKDQKTPNAYLTYVVNLSDVPGMTLSRVAINGVWMTMDGSGHPDYGQRFTGEYLDYAWVKYYNGSQTTADPMLLAKYGSYPDRPWTSDMIGRETCYAILTFRFKQELFSGFPTVLFEVSGIPLYDPRKDTTVGGSGTHRWANRATWQPSDNPFVQIYNIARGIQITSSEFWGGQFAAADLPLTTWFTAMNACDATVSLAAGGSEPAYRAGLEVFCSDEPASVIEQLLKSCSGDVCDIGGVWKARAGGVALPVYMFTDDDLIITQSATFDPFPAGLSGVYNAAVATYPEPVSSYETETSPQMLFATFEAEDGGQRLPASLSLPSVPYTNQVQRLCDAYVRDNRRFRRHSVPMPPAAMLLEPLDATAWTSDLNGYSGKVFEVEEVRDDIISGLQGVSIRERDSADYSWSSSRELPTDPRPFTLVLPVTQTVPSWTVTGVSLVDASSAARRPALRLTWDGSEQDGIAGIEWEIRLTGTTVVAHRGSTTLLDAGTFDYAAGILPNMGYEARGRFLSNNARSWSAWTAATTPDTGFTDADFGSAGAYETLFTDFGLYAIRDVTVLPASGAFVGEKVFNRTDGKLYQWNGTAWTLVVAAAGPGTVTTASFAAGIAPVEILAALPTTGNYEGRTVFLTTDNKLYRHLGTPTGSAGFTRATDGADIAASTLTAASFATNIAPVEIFGALPTTGNYAGRTVFLTTDSKLYRYNGTAFVSTVPTTDLTGTISTVQIADGALTTAKFAAGIEPVEILAALPTTGNFQGRTVFLTTDNKLYRHTGSPTGSAGFTRATDGADITANTITAGQIAAGAIGATEIAAGAILASKLVISDFSNVYPDYDMLDPSFYTSPDGATIAFVNSNSSLLGTKTLNIAANAAVRTAVTNWFTIERGAEYLVTAAAQMSSAVAGSGTSTITFETASYTAGGIITGLTSDMVDTKTDSGSAALGVISVVAGTTARLGRFVITRSAGGTAGARAAGFRLQKKGTGALTVDGTITGTKIAANTITAGQIAANTITSNEIAANTITAGQIAAGAIGATQIAAGAILASKVLVSDFANIYPDFDMLDAAFYTSPNSATMTFVGNVTAALGRKFLNIAVNAAVRDVNTGWFTIEPSTEYLAAAAAFMSSSAAGSGTVSVSFQTGSVAANGVVTGLTTTLIRTATNSTVTTSSAVSIVSDATARAGRFVITRAAGGTGSARAAGFKLQKKGTGALTVDGTITGTKIAAGTITAANIAADTITAGQIAAGAISTSELAAGAVTAAKIAAGTITANEITANTITGGLLAASGIITSTAQIGNGLITNALIGGIIQSTNYVAGVSGWMIDKAGGAEMNSLTVREDMIVNGAVSRKYHIYKLATTSVAGAGNTDQTYLGATITANPVARVGNATYPDNPVLVTITGKIGSAGSGNAYFSLYRYDTGTSTWVYHDNIDFVPYTSAGTIFTMRYVDSLGYSGYAVVPGDYRLGAYKGVSGDATFTVTKVVCTIEQLNK